MALNNKPELVEHNNWNIFINIDNFQRFTKGLETDSITDSTKLMELELINNNASSIATQCLSK